MFQSQTRRLLPRNSVGATDPQTLGLVSIADATLASPQPLVHVATQSQLPGFQSQTRRLLPRNLRSSLFYIAFDSCFNRRRDACFPATVSGFSLAKSTPVS